MVQMRYQKSAVALTIQKHKQNMMNKVLTLMNFVFVRKMIVLYKIILMIQIQIVVMMTNGCVMTGLVLSCLIIVMEHMNKVIMFGGVLTALTVPMKSYNVVATITSKISHMIFYVWIIAKLMEVLNVMTVHVLI